MASEQAHNPVLCAKFHRASELIGRRWTGAIIYLLLQQRCRFAALRAGIPDITDRMLSERLQELEEEEIVARTVVPATPVRVEYPLTPKGHALAKAMDAIGAWANDWLRAEEPPAMARPPKTTRRQAPKKSTSHRAAPPPADKPSLLTCTTLPPSN